MVTSKWPVGVICRRLCTFPSASTRIFIGGGDGRSTAEGAIAGAVKHEVRAGDWLWQPPLSATKCKEREEHE